MWYDMHTMKLHLGSIQRKGRNLHLVTACGNKRKWVSLKTSDPQLARQRARKLLPPDDSELGWLRHLAAIGDKAKEELRRKIAVESIGWDNLWDAFLDKAGGTISSQSESSYERWIRILSETANRLDLGFGDLLGQDACMKISIELSREFVSSGRMLVFFRRVWRTLGLDASVWAPGTGRCRKERQFYRRLSLVEVKTLHSHLAGLNPALADMVLIGYSTGLRMSDVAELEKLEIADGASFLSIVPNKTRLKKPIPLKIPLLPQACETVLRRFCDAQPDGHLFDRAARNRPSRRISKACSDCGILRQGNGRASFHSLRATFISMMDEAGVPPHITDAITGHSGGGMHGRYTQPSLQAMREAIARAIPPLDVKTG